MGRFSGRDRRAQSGAVTPVDTDVAQAFQGQRSGSNLLDEHLTCFRIDHIEGDSFNLPIALKDQFTLPESRPVIVGQPEKLCVESFKLCPSGTQGIFPACEPINGGGGPLMVGGEFLGVETTSVLVAGAQHTAAWMIPPIVAAVGIGIVLARKF